METDPVKLVFLDIDGVLATWWSYKNQRSGSVYGRRIIPFNPECVKHFNTLIERTGAKIVMSSSWRVGQLLENLQNLLAKEGVKGELIGDTPVLCFDPYARRGGEIREWMAAGGQRARSFVILDDEVTDIKSIFPGRFVHTSMVGGFQESDIQKAIDILDKEITSEERETIRRQPVQ